MAAVQLFDIATVLQITGLPRRTFYDMRERGTFPEPLKLTSSGRIPVWPSDVIEAWCRANGRHVFIDRARETVSVSTD